MKLFRTLILTVILLMAGTSTLWAEETAKKPLDEVFDNAVVIPFNYHDKVFLNGQKTDVFGDYTLHQRNGRVFVPIRMMGYLVAWMDNSHCEVVWDPQKPDDVILVNQGLKQTVKLTVNSKTMYINNQPQTLDVPPQKIEGRVMLPLRGIAEALDKKIVWFDGLIVISNDAIDLQSPQSVAIKDKIKAKLADYRKEVAYEKKVTPVAKYGDTVYYTKIKYINNGQKMIEELYKKTGSGPEVKIELPGENRFNNNDNKLINNELYYVSTINGKSELHIFSFTDNKSRKLCSLGRWNPMDGWLADMKFINDEFYVVLHSGDLTMGSEDLYKLENGVLKEITGVKEFISFDVEGKFLYYTDFHPILYCTENLFRMNMETGEKQTLAEKEFTYGISRTVHEQGGTSYTASNSFYIKDGYVYVLGYKENDPGDKASVYKISLDGQTKNKLTPPVKTFWLVDQAIYYLDSSTGYLATVDLEGNNKKTLVDKSILDLKFFDGNIYYTVGKDTGTGARLGKLYKYNLSSGQEIKLSNQSVSEFLIGKTGIYYKAEGYDLGLYKIGANGQSICLVDDTISSFLLTDSGVVYTMRYMEGIYTVE